MLETKTCKNNCIFCFIDQLPKGMRESLYVKDDDERLSFLTGNYITMTNLTEEELNRIIRYRIMPMNLSIHTTNPELRCRMLNNRFAGDVISYLEKFRDHHIQMNGQIVLVPDYNDDDELRKTLADLKAFYPVLQSVSVVPVGLSRHRQGLAEIRAFNQMDALKTLAIINTVHQEMTEKYGDGFVYPSDEFFLLADVPIPDVSYYNGFPQIENGVGMMADFKASLKTASENYKKRHDHDHAVSDNHRIGLITGHAAHAFMTSLMDDLKQVMPDLDVIIYPIKNDYFGEKITVSGLITGRDIIEQVKPELQENPRDLLLIPENALRQDTELLLDDWTLELLSEHLGVKIVAVPVDGTSLIETIRT